MSVRISRRKLIGSLGAGAGGLLLAGCDRINESPAVQRLLGAGQGLTMRAQRIVTDRTALAPEFTAADMSPVFRTNGNTLPADKAYQAHAATGFAAWRRADKGVVTYGTLKFSGAYGHFTITFPTICECRPQK